MSPPIIPTEQVRADQIKLGDTIWAPDDGDWLRVSRFAFSEYDPDVIFYRLDGSEAAFARDKSVLRHAAPASSQQVVNIARCPEHGLHGERTECFVCGNPVEQVPMIPFAVLASQENTGGEG